MPTFIIVYKSADAGAPQERMVVERESYEHAYDAWYESLSHDPDWELISIMRKWWPHEGRYYKPRQIDDEACTCHNTGVLGCPCRTGNP